MLEKNVVLLWSEIRERLSPPDLQKIISLFLDFNRRKINEIHTIDSALLLLEKDEYLYRRFAEFIHRTNNSQREQEDEEGETQNGEIREDHLRGDEIRVEVDEIPREDSLSGHQEDEDGETRDRDDEVTDVEEGKSQEDHLRDDPKIEDEKPNLYEIRVEVAENPEGDSLSGHQEDEDGETRDRDDEVTDVEEGKSQEDHLRDDPKIEDEKANLYEIMVEVAENPEGDSLHGRDQEAEDGETRNSEVVTDVEEGKIREDHLLRDPKIEDEANQLDIRVEVDESPKGDSLHGDQEDEDGETKNGEVNDNEEGEVRGDHLRDPEIEVDENPKGDPLPGDKKIEEEANHHLEVRVTVDENPKEVSFAEMNLEGKKRKRASRRLKQATPSYKLIFEEEQRLASDTVLNNKYTLKKLDGAWRRKKLTRYEEMMAECEDHMYMVDMFMRDLSNAVESAEKVTRGDMRLEDVGVKFYRCIGRMYDRDMSETVREHQQAAIPMILGRLKQKLDELQLAREMWKPIWKKAFEENTAKQRDWAAQGRRGK